MQRNLEDARQAGYLELTQWANIMLQRIRMNFDVQRIWPRGGSGGGPYKDYWIVNMARKGKYRSTGEAFSSRNLYAKVLNGSGGNTVAVDFFFRYYLYFVDWGVGAGQKKSKVPEHGIPKMKSRYGVWSQQGDRQRRPVIMGTIKGGRFFLGKIMEDYWQQQAETVILYGLGYDENGEFKEF